MYFNRQTTYKFLTTFGRRLHHGAWTAVRGPEHGLVCAAWHGLAFAARHGRERTSRRAGQWRARGSHEQKPCGFGAEGPEAAGQSVDRCARTRPRAGMRGPDHRLVCVARHGRERTSLRAGRRRARRSHAALARRGPKPRPGAWTAVRGLARAGMRGPEHGLVCAARHGRERTSRQAGAVAAHRPGFPRGWAGGKGRRRFEKLIVSSMVI